MSPPPPVLQPTVDGLAAGTEGLAVAGRSQSKRLGGRAARWAPFLRALGPGWLVAVGYVDPGNWATDVAGGSAYGYALLWVVAGSSLAAIVLQVLAARLGLATGRDLAQLCAERAPGWARIGQWLLAELAICACDLAELAGAAIALKLLFGLPIAIGVCLTGLDALLLLLLRRAGARALDAAIAAMMALVAACLAVDLAMAHPHLTQLLRGLEPTRGSLAAPGALYLAIGIVGATVMPHNLYLHSALARRGTPAMKTRTAARAAALDTGFALAAALAMNAAILALAAAAFHDAGHTHVAGLQDAYRLLAPLIGPLAAVLFATALLAAGQSSAVTATLAGQVVMEGFVSLRLPRWARRLATRLLALFPALFVSLHWGEPGLGRLLIGSQVLLSLQLPFAMIPLLIFTSDRRRMGVLATPRWLAAAAWAIAALILALSAALIFPGLTGA